MSDAREDGPSDDDAARRRDDAGAATGDAEAGAELAGTKAGAAERDPAETDPAETDPAETDPAETDPPETDPPETDPPASDAPLAAIPDAAVPAGAAIPDAAVPPLPAASVLAPRPTGLRALSAAFERHELAVVAFLACAVMVAGLWSYQLIDPWETHYGEVARRMIQDHDWVHLKWQNESFRSKPVLTFWLMASGMTPLGVAQGGGYSGELVHSDLAVFAVRLPFALFGAFGLVMTWWMLARLVSRRVAWMATAIIATCPFYVMVSRQAITDIPMVATLMGAIACFAMMVHRGDEPLRPFFRRGRVRLDAHAVFLCALALLSLWQAVYYLQYFLDNPRLAAGVRAWQPGIVLCAGILLALVGFGVWSLALQPTRTRGQVWMYWFYFLTGVSALGKGPPGVALAGAICLFYLILTGRWRLLGRIEFFRGVLVAAIVAVPWHLAMWFKDGRGWVREYFKYHWIDRISQGVHGDRGTFDYYSSILGAGLWPWIALLPAALLAIVAARRARAGQRDDGEMRLLIGVWAIVGAAFFAITKTKFHHYILPVVPPLAMLIAFWLDDVLSGRGGRVALAALLGAALALLVTRDLLGEPKQLIELFIYRYDRPWPSGPPWSVDVSDPIFGFGVLAAASLVVFALPWRRVRAAGLAAFFLSALGFSLWAANGYMQAAAPHWGQRELHRTYYEQRKIHGLEIKYWSLRDLADEWGDGRREVVVESVLPEGFATGLPMTVTLLVPGAGVPGDEVELHGQVSSVGDDRFTIAVPDAERAKLAPLVQRGRGKQRGKARRPWRQVDADRLLAWQLNWRGENFWSSGEIYGETEDTRTVFKDVDNKAFLAWLKDPARKGRTFFVITEAGRAAGLKRVLPTPRAKDTVESIDTSCNKFTLLRFEL